MTAPHDPTTDTTDVWPPALIDVIRSADAEARTYEHPDAQAVAAEALRTMVGVERRPSGVIDLTAPAGDAVPFAARWAA